MPNTINADNGVVSGSAGLKSTADSTGVLALQTNGTTAISIDASQAVSFTNSPTVTGGTANGVAYLNGSTVLTTGSALRFDGSGLVGTGKFQSQLMRIKDSGYSELYFSTADAGGNGALSYEHSTNSLRTYVNGGIKTVIDSSGNLGVGTTSPDSKLHISGAANLRIAYNGTSVNYMDADTNIFRNGNGTERARIDSSGNLLVGTTSLEGNGKIVTVNSFNGIVARTTAAANSYEAVVASRTATVGKAITLWYDLNAGTQSGFINIDSTSSVSLNNTSDYRAKENIQPLTNSIARIQNLKPVSFKFKADGYFAEGFIAHEFAEVIPQAVHGEKDAVDENGKPVYQAIDQSKIVPLLTAAIQEQQALITQLQADVAALKGA
jgi:hypothetical protein